MPLLKTEYHKAFYILGLLAMAVSVTLSLYVMSLAQFWLMLNWLAEGRLKQKFKTFFQNKAALAFFGIYALHLLGLLYTYNFSFAAADLRIKLPLLGLPIIMASSQALNRRTINYILLFHVSASFLSTLSSLYIFFTQTITDMRQLSVFISHIRFSLNLCVDVFILMSFIFGQYRFKRWHKAVFGLLAAWFVYFMLFMESFTGIFILLITGLIVLLVFFLKKTKPLYRMAFFAFLMLGCVAVFFYFRSLYHEVNSAQPIDVAKLQYTTSHGGTYVHDIDNKITDNGNYTWMYVCEEELQSAWNKRSPRRYDSVDRLHQPIKFTLVRYLTSKGLRKDMDGVNALSDAEVHLIENGVANRNNAKIGSFENRIKNTIWEYENYKITHDPRGRSMIQRMELWRVSFILIQKNLWFGSGTGDVNDVFTYGLYNNNSLLYGSELRSHNQYLTITLAFGLVGLLVFLFCIFYPPFKLKKFSNYLYLSFFLIVMISMLTEDTLETQAGVTFFAFFSCLFLFADKKQPTTE
ncbi:MAG: O-antigen ligase family protein [Bacteroidota bacterium]